jgi:hypothetical protein
LSAEVLGRILVGWLGRSDEVGLVVGSVLLKWAEEMQNFFLHRIDSRPLAFRTPCVSKGGQKAQGLRRPWLRKIFWKIVKLLFQKM